jgi:hypothetical protein
MARAENIPAIEKATGRQWSDWMEWLDAAGARQLGHTQIAAMVLKELQPVMPESPGWWAQGVTVAYEQSIGRRVPGQRADGTFEFNVSRTVNEARETVFTRLTEWLSGETAFQDAAIQKARTSVTPVRSYWRCDLEDGGKVAWSIESKGGGKTLVVVTHGNLPSAEEAERWRTFWSGYLDVVLTA